MPERPKEPSWRRFDRAELQLGLGRAQRAERTWGAARAVLEAVVVELAAQARQRPIPVIERRLARAQAELAAVLWETGGSRAQIVELATAAAHWLRTAGGERGEVAELERVAAGR